LVVEKGGGKIRHLEGAVQTRRQVAQAEIVRGQKRPERVGGERKTGQTAEKKTKMPTTRRVKSAQKGRDKKTWPVKKKKAERHRPRKWLHHQ